MLTTYFMLPCLNEAVVVGASVQDLLSRTKDSFVVVVDDASDDGTAAIARLAAEEMDQAERVILVRRTLPNARVGKRLSRFPLNFGGGRRGRQAAITGSS